MSIVPLEDRILVKRVEQKETTASGLLIIPESGKEKPQEGIVVAVGPGKISEYLGYAMPVGVKVDDRVLFGKYAGSEIEVEGQTLVVLTQHELLGRYES